MASETLLIVQPEVDTLRLMAEAAALEGHPCHMRTEGGSALLLLEHVTPNLVIADMVLPDMTGLEFLSRARPRLVEPSLVILTGDGASHAHDRIVAAGADDFVEKPFDLFQFRGKLRQLINRFRLEAENLELLRRQAAQALRLENVLAVATGLTSELSVERLFPLIIGKVTEALNAERTSLYVIDWEQRELWTKIAEQVEEIRLPLGEGISGRVAESGEIIQVDDAWTLPYFNREFDHRHNFRTRGVLCLPIRNQMGERIGVIQVINKKNDQGFNSDDLQMLKGLTTQVGIALENSLLHEEMRVSFESSVRTLSATVDARHPLTAGHSLRVTDYSLLIAQELGLNTLALDVIKYASLLHDIGKIGIRDQVLLKNGPFTPEERTEMNSHPSKTRMILENFHFPRSLKDVPLVAALHHEKFNGQGYPYGLSGEGLPLGSRIIAVADVFDALTSPRDYPKYTQNETLSHTPMPLVKAVQLMRTDAGRHFDPEVVTAFNRCLPQILLMNRGGHFPHEYVDPMLQKIAPEMLL
jgi:response regulator RpfG family c-di-GMP phosphodiesterase